MENSLKPFQESKNKKKDSNKKRKILGNKSSENYLLNIISYLLNNKNDFEEKLKPNDIGINLYTDSEISTIDNLIYKLKLNYISFNPKRDIINNLKIYKGFPPEIELKDEYYSTNKNFSKKIHIDFYPSLHKNMYLDISAFPFFYYNIEKKSLEKYYFKLKNNINKFVLCLYLSKLCELEKIVEGLKYIDNIFDYFENIYIITQINTKEEILSKINDNKISKIVLDNNNNDENNKIKFVFNILSIYIPDDLNENVFNIFNNKEDYFFILNENNKIISIKNDIKNLIVKISLFILNLKKLMNNGKKNYKEIEEEKNNKKVKKFEMFIDILSFVLKLKNLDYIFDFDFQFSFNGSVNEEYTDFSIKKINSINIRGEFRSEEYQYLENLLNMLKNSNKNIDYKLKEITTIDIDIDFNDMKCFKCSKIIPDDKCLYYCYICKMKYCYECVHEQLKKEGKEKYIDKKHNLLFFKTRNKKNFMNLDRIKLGENKFAESTNDNQFNTSHSAICNGCRGHFPKMARYVCLHCRPGVYLSGGYIDFCQNCIEKMCTDENSINELEEKTIENISVKSNNFTKGHIIKNRHKHEDHIYLLLPLEYESNSGSVYNHY